MSTATEIVLDGRGLLESPRWHRGRLFVSDWSAGQVLALDLEGRVEVVARVAALPLCSAGLPDGSLLVVDSAAGRLLRLDAGQLNTGESSPSSYAELGRSGWNDIVADGRGNVYLNRPGFDPSAGEEFRPGSVQLVKSDRALQQVADDIAFPNGMAVDAENTTLVVADSYGHRLVGFDLCEDGTLAGRRNWAELGEGTPDGICFDAEGAVWYADVPNRHCVRVAEGGRILQTVEVDRGAFACTLGGPDGRSLFVAAAQWRGMSAADLVAPGSGQVLSVRVDVPGAGWP